MNREITEDIRTLQDNSLYTAKVGSILKDLYSLAKDGIKSLKVKELSDKDVEALNLLGYTVELYQNEGEFSNNNYFIVNGLF